MKKLSAFVLMFTAFASSAQAACVDLRVIMLRPCPSGEKMVFLKGECKKSYEAEEIYCAKRKPQCIDQRAVMMTPCEHGEEMIFVQGRCKKSYEFEHHYCAQR